MREHLINHPHNEASAMIAVYNQRLLDAFAWDRAFWIASDEAPAHKALAVLGRGQVDAMNVPRLDFEPDSSLSENDSWQVVRAKCKRLGAREPTDDSEAMARAGSWIYLFGSHFGSKKGPLDPERHFVARFNEALVRIKPEKRRVKLELEVARPAFALHRAINDALCKPTLKLLPLGKSASEGYIASFISDRKGDVPEAYAVRPEDYPLNIEGVTFVSNGRLLVGLRYPVTSDGHPILVEIDGIDRIFTDSSLKSAYKDYGRLLATRVLVLANVGSSQRPRGIRAMDQSGSTIHVITGDLDSDSAESRILADHPEGAHADSDHRVFEIPSASEGNVVRVRTRRIRKFSEEANVEGIALIDDGTIWYAHDDERIRLHEATPN